MELRIYPSDACDSPDVSLAPAAHQVTQPEIRFVDSIVKKHLVSTFRTAWPLFQAFSNFLLPNAASRGATEPIYGMRANDQFRTAHT